jgi:hypothetical protein
MLPDLPDLGLLAITLLGIAGLSLLCLALMTAGGLMLARTLAERRLSRVQAGHGTPRQRADS